MAEAGTLADVFRPQVTLQISDDFLRVTSEEAQMAQDSLLAQSLMAEQRQNLLPAWRNESKQFLTVKIDRADLVKNYGFAKMDPYCKITVENRVFETPTCYSASTKPTWNKSIRCPCKEKINSFLIEIMDENQFYADSRIAYCNVQITDEMISSQDTHTLALPLSGTQGEGKEGILFLQIHIQDVETFQNDVAEQYQLAVALSQNSQGNPETTEAPIQSPQEDSSESQEELPYIPSEGEIKQLHEMFPTVEEAVVKSVLEVNEGNMISSINSMLSLTEQEEQPKNDVTNNEPTECQSQEVMA